VALTILCVAFLLLLLLGVPVAFAIGLSAVCAILWEGMPVAMLFQQMMSGMNIFSFLAIPFFVFSGELMLHGGIAERIVAFARSAVGHIRGGLGMSNVFACTLFGGVSGSPVADVSAMGSVMIPMMKREGYHVDYAVNVTTHASLVGALMPTSHNMIIYSLAAGGKVSIGALIAHPALWRKMRKLKTGITSDNTPLAAPAEVAALPKLWTTAAPLTSGTTAKAVLGRWSDLLFGVRKSITIKVLSEAFLGSNLQVAVLAYARVDFGATRQQSFCTMEGITVA